VKRDDWRATKNCASSSPAPSVRHRGASLRENERLRFRVAGLERELEQPAGRPPLLPQSVQELTERLHALERERDDLLARFRQVEAMNRSVAARYEEIEAQNNNLANLYSPPTSCTPP